MRSSIIGLKFGLLTVIKASSRTPVRGEDFYHCTCNCGNNTIVGKYHLTGNVTKSCGCLKRRKGNKNPKWKGCGELGSSMWWSIKRHAKQRGLKCNISIEQAWKKFVDQDKKCALTGQLLSLGTFAHDSKNTTASLDRIDSTKGYIAGNIQWVHKDINDMKSNYDEETFIRLCKLVAVNN